MTGVDGNRTHPGPCERPHNGFEGRGTHQASGHSLSTGLATRLPRLASVDSTTLPEQIQTSGTRMTRTVADPHRNPLDGRPRAFVLAIESSALPDSGHSRIANASSGAPPCICATPAVAIVAEVVTGQ